MMIRSFFFLKTTSPQNFFTMSNQIVVQRMHLHDCMSSSHSIAGSNRTRGKVSLDMGKNNQTGSIGPDKESSARRTGVSPHLLEQCMRKDALIKKSQNLRALASKER